MLQVLVRARRISCMDAATQATDEREMPKSHAVVTPAAQALPGSAKVRWVLALLVLAAAVVVAWKMTGDAPHRAGAGVSNTPPPMVLSAAGDEDADLVAGQKELAAGKMREAQETFTKLVAAHPDGVDAQVGLVLTRWQTLGPASVAADLRQLTREYPEAPTPMLQLGLVQILQGGAAAGNGSLRDARRVARAAGDFGVADVAGNVLYPKLVPGRPPLFVGSKQVGAADRGALVRLGLALDRRDDLGAAKVGVQLQRSQDPAAHVAGIMATWTRDEPTKTEQQLVRYQAQVGAAGDAADRRNAKAVVALHLAYVRAWSADVAGTCAALKPALVTGVDPAWARAATALDGKVCTAKS